MLIKRIIHNPFNTIVIHVTDNTATTLYRVSDIELAISGDRLDLLVSSLWEPGLTRIGYDLSTLGSVLIVESGGGTVTGSSGDDQLAGSSMDDTLLGAAGDDTIADGAGEDLMSGGPGADFSQVAAECRGGLFPLPAVAQCGRV